MRGRLATGEGSGLGLAIVRDIADLHGAGVTVRTTSGGGTCAPWHFVQAGARAGFRCVTLQLSVVACLLARRLIKCGPATLLIPLVGRESPSA